MLKPFCSGHPRWPLPVAMLTLLSLAQGCCDPQILTESLPPGRVGEPYVFALESACGDGFWYVSGELPPGLAFTSEGVFMGTPTFPGLYFLTVTWEDRDFEGYVTMSVSKGFTLLIDEADAPASVQEENVFEFPELGG